MLVLLVQQVWAGTNSPGPMCKGIEITVFSREVVMAVWSMLVGFLYSVDRVSDLGETKLSKNCMNSSVLGVIAVNCI